MWVEEVAVGSFEAFLAESCPWACRLAGFFTQDRAAGEEIAESVLSHMYETWGQAERPEAHLRRSLVNASHNWRRHNRTVRDKLPLLHAEDRYEPVLDELADIIARLPFRQRVVIVLRYYGSFSEAEIAEALGCRPGAVKSLSSRALARLARETSR